MIWNRFRSRRAEGGAVQGQARHPDSVLVKLCPGYVSFDNGATWYERPDDTTEYIATLHSGVPGPEGRDNVIASQPYTAGEPIEFRLP